MLAIGLAILFFVPFPPQFFALKIVVALMVISYILSVGAFRKKHLFEQGTPEEGEKFKKRLKEVEKKSKRTRLVSTILASVMILFIALSAVLIIIVNQKGVCYCKI